MDRKILLKPLVYLMFFIFGAYLLDQKFYLHNSFWWFDIAMHFLGGFWVGMFFIWFFSAVNLPFVRQPIQNLGRQTLLFALYFILFVGIAWEAGEFMTFNTLGRDPFILIDTVSDIFFDLAGGLSAMLYVSGRVMPKTLNRVE